MADCNAALLADRLLADQSTGRLDRDLEWAFRHLLDAAYHRALREAREQGKSGVTLGADPQAVIRVLVELYGPDDGAVDIGKQIEANKPQGRRTMIYYLHLRQRDCIPERYVIRISRTEHINPRTNDETKVIGEFATAVEAYAAAVSRGDAPIYKGIRNDFDIKVFGRDDLEGTV